MGATIDTLISALLNQCICWMNSSLCLKTPSRMDNQYWLRISSGMHSQGVLVQYSMSYRRLLKTFNSPISNSERYKRAIMGNICTFTDFEYLKVYWTSGFSIHYDQEFYGASRRS